MKRLEKEFNKLSEMYDVEYVDNNSYKWRLALFGPDGTPYFGGTFLVEISMTENYPFESPCVKFLTKIYHPNINSKGDICLAILKDEWNASKTILNVIEDIEHILIEPNYRDPLVHEIAEQNREDYIKKAEEVTRKYAI